jgi:hypothetical protein
MVLGVLLLVSSFYSLALYGVPCELFVHVHFLPLSFEIAR